MQFAVDIYCIPHYVNVKTKKISSKIQRIKFMDDENKQLKNYFRIYNWKQWERHF